MTGYSVTQTEVYLVDDLIERHFVSLVFTALAISGLTNAINVIDGFNGLAAGAVIIMASAFGVVAYMVDDYELVLLAAIIVAYSVGVPLGEFSRWIHFSGRWRSLFRGFPACIPGDHASRTKSGNIGMGQHHDPGISAAGNRAFDFSKNDP